MGFSRSPPQIFPFLLALRGYFQNFHMSSQTQITDLFVNSNVQGVFCYPPAEIYVCEPYTSFSQTQLSSLIRYLQIAAHSPNYL